MSKRNSIFDTKILYHSCNYEVIAVTDRENDKCVKALKKGDGKGCPKYGQTVTVHYTGTLLDGRMFDSSVHRGQPASFQIGQVIDGWNEALQTMSKGEKRTDLHPRFNKDKSLICFDANTSGHRKLYIVKTK